MSEQLWSAGIDHLTGALGRRSGLAAVKREMDRCARANEPFVLVFVDVDGLKAINDAGSHSAGDAALRQVARCLSVGLRSSDVVLRYGGDEFICSLGGSDTRDAHARMARISDELGAATSEPTISYGLAERRTGERIEDLVARSDCAMIKARSRQRS